MSTADQVLGVLQRYSLTQDGEGWRCNSPFRPNSDSKSFVLKITSPEHGTFFDHHPSANPQSGSLYELARALGIALPATITVENTKRSYDGIEDYARAHGVTADVLRHWGWRETEHMGRAALEFQTQSGLRWRFLDGEKGKPTYISVAGYTRCWYGMSNTLKAALQDGLPLVLCNGEISTITGRYYGVPALAMTSGEKGEIPVELLNELKGFLSGLNVEIIIALDCDKAGRAAARGLQAQLNREGFKVRAVDLSLSTGGDLADFCMLYQHDAIKQLQKLPALPTIVDTSKWTFASIDDLLKLSPVDWLVAGQLPARGLTMLYGASGTFKSFFMLDQVMRLAGEGVPILYIAAEGEYGYRQRVEAWIKHHGYQPKAITFVLGSVDLFDSEELTEFQRIVEQYKPRVIVVDTFAMCSGMADENSSRDMLTIVNACKTMSRVLDALVVVIHHTNAEGKKERGSKVLRNACDTIIRVSLEDDLISVQSQKTKDSKPFETYYLSPISKPLGYNNNIGEEVSSVVLLPAAKVMRSKDLTPLQRRVLEYLAVEPNASVADIADAVECDSRGTISKVISALVTKGFVRITSTGREVTPDGNRVAKNDSNDSTDSYDSIDLQKQQIPKPMATPESLESSATTQATFNRDVRSEV